MLKTLLTISPVFLSIVFSGQIEFERFTIDNGLSQNTVYDVFQDSRGYLWMGTQGGLDRFNGYEFKQYEHESSDTTSIVDGWIRSIQEDEDGILWLGTANGNFGWFNPFEEVGGEIDLYENHPGVQRPARIDEILLEGLPLGSFKGETFSLVDFEFKQGDSLVFISDGLPEAVNHTEDMLGYQAVQDCVQANGHHNANDQKQALLDLGSAWLGGLRNQDDITIVVVKKT